MQVIKLDNRLYIVSEGFTLSTPITRKPSVSPQLAIKGAQSVYDRTLRDSYMGGPVMAQFMVEQHLRCYFQGPNSVYRMSPRGLKKVFAHFGLTV